MEPAALPAPRPPLPTSSSSAAAEHHDLFAGSPKRKRDVADVSDQTRSPLRLRTELPSRGQFQRLGDQYQNQRLDVTAGTGGGSILEDSISSPRTRVSDQLQGLHIQPQPQPQLSFRGKMPPAPSDQQHGGQAPPPPPGMDEDNPAIDHTPPQLLLLQTGVDLRSGVQVQVSFTENPPQPELAHHARSTLLPEEQAREEGDLAQPQTPHLRPESSPQSAPRTISPLPCAANNTNPFETPYLLQPLTYSGPSTNSTPQPNRLTSPTLSSSSSSSLVWTPEEITGHDPTDPADDGYGINGIGFRPTAAMAQARLMRRRQQVAEWKSREAKEARLKRAERRRGATNLSGGGGGGVMGSGSGSGSGAASNLDGGLGGSSAEGGGGGGPQARRVRFVEG